MRALVWDRYKDMDCPGALAHKYSVDCPEGIGLPTNVQTCLRVASLA